MLEREIGTQESFSVPISFFTEGVMEAAETQQRIRAGYRAIHDELDLQVQIWMAMADYHRLLYRCYLYGFISEASYFRGCSTIADWEPLAREKQLSLFPLVKAKRELAHQVQSLASKRISTCLKCGDSELFILDEVPFPLCCSCYFFLLGSHVIQEEDLHLLTPSELQLRLEV